MTDQDEADLRRKAARRADAKLAFRYHLIVYLLVNAGLVVINVVTGPGTLWFLWPALGWGVGLAVHGMVTYSRGDSREDLIEAEMQRLRARRQR